MNAASSRDAAPATHRVCGELGAVVHPDIRQSTPGSCDQFLQQHAGVVGDLLVGSRHEAGRVVSLSANRRCSGITEHASVINGPGVGVVRPRGHVCSKDAAVRVQTDMFTPGSPPAPDGQLIRRRIWCIRPSFFTPMFHSGYRRMPLLSVTPRVHRSRPALTKPCPCPVGLRGATAAS